jgi:hypothetical protein
MDLGERRGATYVRCGTLAGAREEVLVRESEILRRKTERVNVRQNRRGHGHRFRNG